VNPDSATIGSGDIRTITVTFTPDEIGLDSATITVSSNDSDEGTLYLNVSGIGRAAEIELSTTSLSIGDVKVGSSKAYSGNEIDLGKAFRKT